MTRKLALTLVVCLTTLAFTYGQQLNSTGLYRHGTNSGSGAATVAPESIDSVSVGSTMDYFVMPDALVNPSYNPATSYTANLNSSFTWTTSPTGVTIATKSGMASNYVTTSWSSAGSYTLNVKEQSSAGCSDATGRNINVDVISLPTAAAGTAPSSPCMTGTDGSLNHTPAAFPITFTSVVKGSRALRVVYTITSTSHGAIATNQTANVTETGSGTGTFTIATPLNYYDSYTITIVSVSDRISRKSNVTSTVTGQSFTYNVNRTPSTGEIYHLPNI